MQQGNYDYIYTNFNQGVRNQGCILNTHETTSEKVASLETKVDELHKKIDVLTKAMEVLLVLAADTKEI